MGRGWGKRGMRFFAVEGRAGGVGGGRVPCRCSGRGVVPLYVSPVQHFSLHFFALAIGYLDKSNRFLN